MNGYTLQGRVQKYVNFATVHDAMDAGFDIVQPKHDGWFAEVIIKDGQASIYSRQGALKEVLPCPEFHGTAVLIGEFLVGTQRATSGNEQGGTLVVFDCLDVSCTVNGKPSSLIESGDSYRHRLEVAGEIIKSLPWAKLITTMPAESAHGLWTDFVEQAEGEGIVLRRSADTYHGAAIGRVKKTVTMDYVVMSVVEGGGKNRGKAGAVVCGLYVNGRLVEKVSVGGGWSDAERAELFAAPQQYVGRVLEVRGYQLFASGSLRHPNVVRCPTGGIKWREDKKPVECVWTK
jgi:ATP-dependent DNA ligase